MRKYIYCLIAASMAVAISLISCGGSNDSKSAVQVTDVTLSKTTATISKGNSETLVATVHPNDATNKKVSWTSTSPGVATVSASGLVTAIEPGTSTIIVATEDGHKMAACTVTVGLSVTGVTLNESAITLLIGGTQTLRATVLPNEATNKNVTWISSVHAIATVDSNGLVTAHAVGTTAISAITVDGAKTATCYVTVSTGIVVVPVTGVTLAPDTLDMVVGENEALTHEVSPPNATDPSVIWTSTQPFVATVVDGFVEAVGAGFATITVTTVDGGFEATCDVVVTTPVVNVTEISLDKNTMNLGQGELGTLTPTIQPPNATNKTVTWSSSNPLIASVVDGVVTAGMTTGLAVISATTVDGGLVATCTVNVSIPIAVTGLMLDEAKATIGKGCTVRVSYTVVPNNATNQNVTWESDDDDVATVQNGVVTAVNPGTAIISATTGPFTKYCIVNVTSTVVSATGVALNKTSTTIGVGGSETLLASVLPNHATIQGLTWSSSNPAIATVNSDGRVNAIATGIAVITVRTTDGGKTRTCSVNVTSPVPVSGVSLNENTLPLGVGGRETLTATVSPANATNKALTWSSSDATVATVANDGTVIARTIGSATITVSTVDGDQRTICTVNVTSPISVTDVELNKATTEIGQDGKERLVATIEPTDATNQGLLWSTSNENVATVNADGTVNALNIGIAVITATTLDGGLSDACTVTVAPPIEVEGVVFEDISPAPSENWSNLTSYSPGTLVVVVGYSKTLVAKVLPENASNQALTWSGNNENATVSSNGTVNGLAPGTATITVVTVDGEYPATCAVTVEPPISVTGMSLNKTAETVLIGTTELLVPSILPTTASDKSVTWASNNPTVAAVNSEGLVTAISQGSARITATTVDGNRTAVCTITVPAPVRVTGISLDRTALALGFGNSETLVATITPANATNQNVVWTSNNARATVSSTGLVTGVSSGNAAITVRTLDGNYSAACLVTVGPPVAFTSIVLSETSIIAEVGNPPMTLAADVLPENANEPMNWTALPPGIVMLTGTGYSRTVTFVGPGTATITAASSTFPGSVFDTCTVTVRSVPGAPTIGTATPGNAQATVNFTPPASDGGTPITGYTVTSAPGGITATGATSPIIVTGLTNGTAYTFTVKATNSVGTGAASAASNSVTPATVPGAPTIGTATPGASQATVAFTPPASNGGSPITLYTVTSSPDAITATGTASPITVLGLTAGTPYTFTVVATNSAGDSLPSAASNSVTPTAGTTVPGAPTIGTATPGNAQASVAFTPPASDGGAAITGYTATSSPGGITGTGAASPITVTGLTNGTSYTFTVTATNSQGTGPASAISNSVTPTAGTTVPGAPTIGTATPGNAQASVAFTPPASDGGDAITGYTATSSPGGITGTAASSPITVTGLTNGTSYTFTVVATNSVGDGPASGASNPVTPATVPDAPTIGTPTAGIGRAYVAFTPPANNGGSSITSYTAISDPENHQGAASGSPITVTGLTPGTPYTFKVYATNAMGDSVLSAESTAVVPDSGTTVPGAPTLVSAVEGNAQATVAFTVPDDDGGAAITGYTATSSPGGITGTNTTTPITVMGLTNGTTYTFTVVATNSEGDGPASAASNPVTPATVPGAPTIGTATAGDGEAEVAFTPPGSNGGATITLYTATSSPGGFTGTGAASPITVTGLTNGTAYTFTVIATNAKGDSAASGASNSVTPTAATTVPGAPTIGTATHGNAQASVAFTPPASDGGAAITGYTATSSPGGFTGTAASSPITVTGLTNGTAYTFTVKATNSVGDGPASGASNSVTPATVPGAPTIGTATAGNEEAEVAFTPPASNGGNAITGYTATSSPGGFTGTAASSPITVTGLTNGTAYTFTVVATNDEGDSAASGASNSVTPATVPGAPTGVSALQTGPGEVTITFSAPGDNGGSAILDYTVTSDIGGYTATENALSIVISGIASDDYVFTVTARNSVGSSTGAVSATVTVS